MTVYVTFCTFWQANNLAGRSYCHWWSWEWKRWAQGYKFPAYTLHMTRKLLCVTSRRVLLLATMGLKLLKIQLRISFWEWLNSNASWTPSLTTLRTKEVHQEIPWSQIKGTTEAQLHDHLRLDWKNTALARTLILTSYLALEPCYKIPRQICGTHSFWRH